MKRAFTLIELLVVISIIAIAMSLVFAMNGRQRDSVELRNSAEELAGVLRKTRTQAIEQKAFFSVAFNITNGKGTSGRVLNNRDGGHWYRVLGPGVVNWESQGMTLPPLADRNAAPGGSVDDANHGRSFAKYDCPVRSYLALVTRSWESPRHVLPAGRVRFLALADQDNGAHCRPDDPYQSTYPRPWFGTWDSGTKKWYPWGGYDPEIADASPWWPNRTGLDGNPISSSGFYYEGRDGRIADSVNPRDRLVWDDVNGNGFIDVSPNNDGAPSWPLLRQGQPRALVNGDWLDSMILFYPDGRVDFSWFSGRREYGSRANWDIDQSFKKDGAHKLGMGDMGNLCLQGSANVSDEVSQYVNRSGYFYITLGRDASEVEKDTFGNPDELIRTLLPAIRVGINRYGEVKVVTVRHSLQAGQELDPTAAGTWWNKSSPAVCRDGYAGNVLGTTGQQPVSDALTREMVQGRQWWLK